MPHRYRTFLIPPDLRPHTEFRGIAPIVFLFWFLSFYFLFLWLFSPWHTDRSLHYTPIHAPFPAVNSLPLYTMRGHSHLGCRGCTMVLLSLELERVLPILLNEKKRKEKEYSTGRNPRPYTQPYCHVFCPTSSTVTCKFQQTVVPFLAQKLHTFCVL